MPNSLCPASGVGLHLEFRSCPSAQVALRAAHGAGHLSTEQARSIAATTLSRTLRDARGREGFVECMVRAHDRHDDR
eukprot:SAG11_NODE_3576_length_2359_cov_1.436283_3_plen_77_part_00